MNARTNLGRVLAGLGASALLAGCAAGSTSPPPPASVPAPPAVPSPTVAPAASPAATGSPTATGPALPPAVTYDAATVVAGTADCTFDLGTGMAGPDGVTQFRDGRLRCTASVNDPRVSGTEQGSWSRDWWGPASGPGAGVQWGTVRLENEGGAWDGKAAGISSTERGDIVAVWYRGTGGYTGLSYFELITGQGPWAIRGQIQPGDPPSPSIAQVVETVTPPPVAATAPAATASPQQATVDDGPVTLVEGSERRSGSWGDFGYRSTDAAGVGHFRGMGSWLHETSDPRVSGADVTDLNMDGWERPTHGAAIQWGSTRLTNPDGAWTGTFSGVFDSVHGDTFVIWYSGSGDYTGLAYFVLGTGTGGDAIRLQGQIYPGTPPAP